MSALALTAARQHAIDAYPLESCGIVVAGVYHPCTNAHDKPEEHFRIEAAEWGAIAAGRPVEMVIHSHPDGPFHPSRADMIAQASWAVPFAIIASDGLLSSEPLIFGDQWPMAPLLGRQFMHGVHDCYSLIRDTFRLGKHELAAQGLTNFWPFEPVTLMDMPRDDGWWADGELGGRDLYTENFEKAGFVSIPANEVRAGDVFLTKIKSDVPNHGGVLVENDLLFHHLPTRISRREPAGVWARSASLWLRYFPEGSTDA